MPFRNDYFRRILEEIEETAEERTAEQRRGDEADTLERVDTTLAEYHRPDPQRLRLSLDPETLRADDLSEQLDDLYEVRTDLCRRLQASEIDRGTVLYLMRSVLVGTQRRIHQNREPRAPAELLAEILRQQRIGRVLDPYEVAEAWRVLFELEADRGHVALAEDYLFHAVRLTEDPEPLIHRGLDFYAEILDWSDAKLTRRGLPRDEARQARWELLELLQN